MSTMEGSPDPDPTPESTVTLAIGDLDATLQRMVSAALERAMAGFQFAPRGPDPNLDTVPEASTSGREGGAQAQTGSARLEAPSEPQAFPDNQQPGPHSAPKADRVWGAVDAFPAQQDHPKGFPLPELFRQIIDKEWQAPARNKDSQRPSSKLYELSHEEMKRLKLPAVDAPVAALGSASVLPTDFEGMPKDAVDRRIEAAIRKTFEAAAGSVRTESEPWPHRYSLQVIRTP
ncbi:hypothetical protein lerEdw1_004271 [Lerista edwardsae]|nr:hypothetical protein lerEdw1_004271 [Lerista edwardsae]